MAEPAASSASDSRPAAAARLRTVHMDMVAAVVAGEGLGRVCNLAADAIKAPVAVIVPRLGAFVGGDTSFDITPIDAYVRARMRSRPLRPASVPSGIGVEVPIESGGETVGAAFTLGDAGADAPELLHAVSVAVLTELAMADARVEVEENLRGSFLEQLRAGSIGTDAVRRAERFGCDLRRGAVALCAEPTGERVRHLIALVVDEVPGALAQLADDGRVHGLIPPPETGDPLAPARRVAARLRPHGVVGLSSFHEDPTTLGRALEEAALVLDVTRMGGAGDVGDGTYRLLFRVLSSHPEEVRSFYDDTIAPLVRYDEQYGSDLVATLEAWFEHDCSTVATAGAIFVHRHTVAYRLERVKDLSGLDPLKSEDRERLGLGLKAGKVIAPSRGT